ncbi:MAG: ABC transporter permease [Actinomycetota bacterium]|nr:ABC transporter permease [Actinomycetota bacterium]MDD5668209.1 ABC transporter permease [Actinomycetota bacterium]
MSVRRVLAIMKKSLNPRNPYIIFTILGPLLFAAIFQLVFGIWQTRPKIAVYEAGDGAITRELEAMEAVDLVAAGSADEVTALVEDKKADVGVVFGEETKKRLEAGERAQVDMYISGESLAKNRAIALAALTGAVRSVSPEVPRVYFEQVRLGEEKALSLMDMFLPFMVIYVILLGGLMLTSSFVVNEKEKRTFAALLVTPVTLPEVLIAFGLVGVIVSLVMGIILMLLTVGFAQPLLMFAIFALGSLLGVEWGLLLGMMSRDQTTLVAYMKAFGVFLLVPALFIVFPDWPQWIARIFPTYYIANPVFRIVIYGEGWSELGWQILALAGFAVLFLVPLLAVMLRTRSSAANRLFTT